jgi:hypothetical protein
LVLNGFDEFSPTARIALIARFPEQEDINGRLSAQTAVNLNVYLTSSTQPKPAYFVYMPERTADELFLMDGFQTYSPTSVRINATIEEPPPEGGSGSSSASFGDGTTPPPNGFGGTSSGSTDARVDGFDTAVARYNAEKATAMAWRDEQATLTAQPAALPLAAVGAATLADSGTPVNRTRSIPRTRNCLPHSSPRASTGLVLTCFRSSRHIRCVGEALPGFATLRHSPGQGVKPRVKRSPFRTESDPLVIRCG